MVRQRAVHVPIARKSERAFSLEHDTLTIPESVGNDRRGLILVDGDDCFLHA